MPPYVLFVCLLWKCLFNPSAHFKIIFFMFLLLSYVSSFYILRMLGIKAVGNQWSVLNREVIDLSRARTEWRNQAGGHSDQRVEVRWAETWEEWVIELTGLSERKGKVIPRFLLVRWRCYLLRWGAMGEEWKFVGVRQGRWIPCWAWGIYGIPE